MFRLPLPLKNPPPTTTKEGAAAPSLDVPPEGTDCPAKHAPHLFQKKTDASIPLTGPKAEVRPETRHRSDARRTCHSVAGCCQPTTQSDQTKGSLNRRFKRIFGYFLCAQKVPAGSGRVAPQSPRPGREQAPCASPAQEPTLAPQGRNLPIYLPHIRAAKKIIRGHLKVVGKGSQT